jgi:peptide/nickel transport system ATP-binding protein
MDEPALLEVTDLAVDFRTLAGPLRVIDGVGFTIARGEVLGLVGESGSGKSVTSLAIIRLLGDQGRIAAGRIRLGDSDLTALDDAEMAAVRGRRVSMIFQEPMTSLNPVFTVGFQIAEVLIEHLGLGRRAATARAVELMRLVGIPAPERRVHDYPHELSGGMRQRVMIAMALACEPSLLIADEPTTALDVTIQAQILDLIAKLRRETGTAVLMITHDLGVIAATADRVAVMYAGQIVEEATVAELFARPRHPYTRLLMKSIPRVGEKRARLEAIEGTTPSPAQLPPGCRFHPRCPDAIDKCRAAMPALESGTDGRHVRCWRADEPGLASELPPVRSAEARR